MISAANHHYVPASRHSSRDDRFLRELSPLIPQLRAFTRFLCRNNSSEADDISQETLLRAWEARSRYTPGTKMRAWLFTIARNLFYSEQRRAWRAVSCDDSSMEPRPL